MIMAMNQSDNNFVIMDDQANYGTMSLSSARKLADVDRRSYVVAKSQQATCRVGR